MTKLYPTDLTDRQWDHIKDLIPPARAGGRPRRLEMRQVVNAILYVVKGGITWRMLPREYPCWQSVYHYFRRWGADGTWRRLHDTLRARVRRRVQRHKHPTAGSLDSQSIHTSLQPGVRGYDGGKRIMGRKRHLAVDTMGLLLDVVVTSGAVQDRDGAKQLLLRRASSLKKMRKFWVDGAYQGQLLTWVRQRFKFQLSPVPKPQDQPGFHVLPRRWVVERTFSWLVAHRRLSRDYEVLTTTSESMMHIAMIRIMLRRLARE